MCDGLSDCHPDGNFRRQGTDAYSSNATVSQYNKGLSLMKAGYTIYLVCIVIYLFMVVSGPLMKRWGFGRPTSIRSATMVRPLPPASQNLRLPKPPQ
jgi:hypothetical protein